MKSRYSLPALFLTASLLTACSSVPAAPTSPSPAPVTQSPVTDTTALPVKFSMSADYKTVTITKGDKLVETINVLNNPESGPEVITNKETSKSIYFETCATGFGGYINYGFCHGPSYRFDRTTNVVRKMLSDGRIFDVSTNEDMFVWVENGNKNANQIKVRTIATDKDQIISVPAKYSQFGDAKFSPNAEKIAYAAIIGDPENEKGSVIIVDLATGKQTYIEQDKENAIYTVKGWKNADAVEYVNNWIQ